MPNGVFTADVYYNGSAIYNKFNVTGQASLTVDKVAIADINVTTSTPIIFVGEDAVYSINVTTTNVNYTVNGFVTVNVGGKYYNVSIVDGLGSFVVHNLANGTYYVNVSYDGSNVYNKFNVTLIL